MNPTISLVTEVEVATEIMSVVGIMVAYGSTSVVGDAAADVVVAVDGACHPMGILGWLRLQVSPHRCGRNEETGLIDRW